MNAAYLIIAALTIPALGAILTAMVRPLRKRARLCGTIFVFASLLALVSAALMSGEEARTVAALPGFMVLGLNWHLDGVSLFFSLLFAVTMTFIQLYSVNYPETHRAQARYTIFSLLTYTGCLGVVLAGDLVTLFLFFELMTFSSYVLVIHKEDRQAMAAGNLYIFLGVLGGLALLSGIILVYAVSGTVDFVALPADVLADTRLVVTVALCFLLGFGIKTGVTPLHVWMPRAYAVQPMPANALSSGIMIKTGAYGLIRVWFNIFSGLGEVNPGVAEFFGALLLGLGLSSMLVGAIMALRQKDARRTLAYSSISQLGYIVLAVAVLVFPYGNPGLGLSGAMFHILNHTVFKVTLFMCLGAVLAGTGTLEYGRLGGMLRRYPLVGGAFIVAAMGVGGMPGFNGYASKTFLHHGLTALEKATNSHWFWLAEKVFVLASALTICYLLKMFLNVFSGPDSKEVKVELSRWQYIPLAFGATAVAFIGLFPHFITRSALAPAMTALGTKVKYIDYALQVNVWDPHDLMEMMVVAAVAAVVVFLGWRFKLDDQEIPPWLSIEGLIYQPLARGFMALCKGPGVFVDGKVNQLYHGTGGVSLDVCRYVGQVDGSIDLIYSRAGTISTDFCCSLGVMDKSITAIFSSSGQVSTSFCEMINVLDRGLNGIYAKMDFNSVNTAISLDGLDRRLDKAYEGLGLSFTRAIQKVSALEDRWANVEQLKRIKKIPPWLGNLQKLLQSPAWDVCNINIEAMIVAIALVTVVAIFVLFGKI